VSIWCTGQAISTASVDTVTDIVALTTFLACLDKLADHHRLGAAAATARVVEVLS